MIPITESNTLKLDYTKTQNVLQLSLAHVELLWMTVSSILSSVIAQSPHES